MVAFLVGGNLIIAAASAWARSAVPTLRRADVNGIANFRMVDSHLFRGAAPTGDGYRWLAAEGVRTVVDLRAEDDVAPDPLFIEGLGLERVAIPIRDGQTPTAAQVQRFLDVVLASEQPVFVHCGAGVGRTGTMVASYLVATGGADRWRALGRNLAVGPPSLEQIAFALDGPGGIDRPSPVVVAVSRVLDAPRRLWARWRAL